jgi:competence protein ComEC
MTVDLLASRINELLPEPHASLVIGMIFGIKSSMPREFYEALITTGTIHMIALSGMNVSIIIWLLFEGIGRYFRKWTRIGLTLGGIVGFVLLVGPGPTIMRASIMAILTIVAAMAGRKSIPLFSLFLASLIMILFNTAIITDISFQLSFFATLGIILFGQQKVLKEESLSFDNSRAKQELVSEKQPVRHQSYIGNILKSDLRITLSAQVFTLPIIFWYFGRISLISPIANLAVAWLVPPIMYLGIGTIICSLIFRPLGYVLSLILWVPVTIFIQVITLFSKVPFASINFQ